MVMRPGGLTGLRERGFDETMAKEFPRVVVAARQFGMADPARSRAAAENILTAHPDLKGLFASSEASSIGAIHAIRSREMSGKVKLITFDSSDLHVDALRAGTIDLMLVQEPFRIGYEAVKSLVEKLDGRTPARGGPAGPPHCQSRSGPAGSAGATLPSLAKVGHALACPFRSSEARSPASNISIVDISVSLCENVTEDFVENHAAQKVGAETAARIALRTGLSGRPRMIPREAWDRDFGGPGTTFGDELARLRAFQRLEHDGLESWPRRHLSGSHATGRAGNVIREALESQSARLFAEKQAPPNARS
jgi:hypothetical protein